MCLRCRFGRRDDVGSKLLGENKNPPIPGPEIGLICFGSSSSNVLFTSSPCRFVAIGNAFSVSPTASVLCPTSIPGVSTLTRPLPESPLPLQLFQANECCRGASLLSACPSLPPSFETTHDQQVLRAAILTYPACNSQTWTPK
jgi:hypothetical protein